MSNHLKSHTTAGVETFLELFRIEPGIPLDHAFDELSVLLGCIRHLSEEAEMEGNKVAGSAARILSAMAKALINDMEMGLNRGG
ncbi:DUF3077 domain-containing protein [Pseudomonas kermanshahensis]|jgi:hypothetical protein|uniref:DUF3077 domain-containing protein n=1 Tax=Pseudomonas kermanshahensis TaxID=2745482 RepID=A0ABU8RCH6_9PSED|nr:MULTISPECIES: DUF3077 domain-containing protein [unclassified Pseudomonas]ATP48599.1 DUF3077 domain-containing protein [Pseudomonas putida]MDE4539142.1 DUF3077 domain-containing protein [Pseudomonas sp. ITEM 17296]SMF09182.1 Protein of unknown function [Pseudomonas sp. LAIL14HWK12:I11]SMR79884.1 Protein of unknown function [Pseudomonas sp. LAIL14HWK12:I10]SOD01675.1 Protein of unknown function [Pseudomonas sp. LAIL14HWK12:I8]